MKIMELSLSSQRHEIYKYDGALVRKRTHTLEYWMTFGPIIALIILPWPS